MCLKFDLKSLKYFESPRLSRREVEVQTDGLLAEEEEIEALTQKLKDYASHDKQVDDLRLAFRMDRWSKAEKGKAVSDEALSLLSARYVQMSQQLQKEKRRRGHAERLLTEIALRKKAGHLATRARQFLEESREIDRLSDCSSESVGVNRSRRPSKTLASKSLAVVSGLGKSGSSGVLLTNKEHLLQRIREDSTEEQQPVDPTEEILDKLADRLMQKFGRDKADQENIPHGNAQAGTEALAAASNTRATSSQPAGTRAECHNLRVRQQVLHGAKLQVSTDRIRHPRPHH